MYSTPRLTPWPWRRRMLSIATLLCMTATISATAAVDTALAPYQGTPALRGSINSIGDAVMGPLMQAWLDAFRRLEPQVHPGLRWEHRPGAAAFGALMFEIADIAPLARPPSATELAPYAHQFNGDMMKSPLLVQVASNGVQPLTIAVNKRPGSPLPPAIKAFLQFMLSAEGQKIVVQATAFAPLDEAKARVERIRLDGYLATLDVALPRYVPTSVAPSAISSVGSDGMKTLMDRWMRDFQALQPTVRKGNRWEHLGTLNGFHALLADETDIAPMGREMWPEERTMFSQTRPGMQILEIRVARGGFNTPQRTTAQAIFVHPDNPMTSITMAQLAAIMGARNTLITWGQLGLTGIWANRAVTLYTPPLVAPNAISMQFMVLKGGSWTASARQAPIADTARAIAADPGAIGFGGFEEGGPGLKTLAVGQSTGMPAYAGTGDTVSSGQYPLTRYMYIRLARIPGQPVAPAVKALLRFILSQAGQEPVLYSGYFPLRADEVAGELDRLE